MSLSFASHIWAAAAYNGNLIHTNPWVNENNGSGPVSAEKRPKIHKAKADLNQSWDVQVHCFF